MWNQCSRKKVKGDYPVSHHKYWPTAYDLVEINFWSIVSDGRMLLNGTLQPRSWADLSSTWNREPVINQAKYRKKETFKDHAEKRLKSAQRRKEKKYQELVDEIIRLGSAK